jgi:type IV pilus assembly protein PilX
MRPLRVPQPVVRRAQRGAALIMVLVFLLLLTMLGVTASNTATLEERMAGNVKDQNLSFQSAETALAFAESWVASTTSAADLTVDNTRGIYAPAGSSVDEVWETVDWSGTDVVIYPGTPGNPVAAAAGTLGDVKTMPKYIIENMGTEPAGTGTRQTVRITARGTGASDNTETIVQSTFSVVYP